MKRTVMRKIKFKPLKKTNLGVAQALTYSKETIHKETTKSSCYTDLNRPFLSSKNSHFQNEAKCETFVVKMSFICIIIKNHFHINGFALSLALKVRFFGTRKWPIAQEIFRSNLVLNTGV